MLEDSTRKRLVESSKKTNLVHARGLRPEND
jgi:hypothetical protein